MFTLHEDYLYHSRLLAPWCMVNYPNRRPRFEIFNWVFSPHFEIASLICVHTECSIAFFFFLSYSFIMTYLTGCFKLLTVLWVWYRSFIRNRYFDIESIFDQIFHPIFAERKNILHKFNWKNFFINRYDGTSWARLVHHVRAQFSK